MSNPAQVQVRILDKDYLIACGAEQREELIEAARMLDQRMRDIRGSGKLLGLDRIAVLSGLNIAHELIQTRNQSDAQASELAQRVAQARQTVESALAVLPK